MLLLAVGATLYYAGVSEVSGARAPDVRPTVGAQGKSQEYEAKFDGFGCLLLWTLKAQCAAFSPPGPI